MWFRSSPPFTIIEIIDQKKFIFVLLLSVFVPHFRTCRVWIIMVHHIFMTASDWMLHCMNISRQWRRKNYTKGSKFCIKKILKKNSLDQQKNPSNFFVLPNDFSFDFSAILVFLLFHLPFTNNLLFFSLPAVKNRKVLRWKAFLCSRFMRF